MGWQIRDYDVADAPGCVAVRNAIHTDTAFSVEQWRHNDDTAGPGVKWRRWVVEDGDAIVAYGGYSQSAWIHHPRKFGVAVNVHPDHREQGIGTALYDRVTEALGDFDPVLLRSFVRESEKAALDFLARRGFAEKMRELTSRLDLTAFDPAAFARDLARATDAGLRIISFAEQAAADPECERRFWAMDMDISRDVPTTSPITPLAFEIYRDQILRGPDFLPDLTMIALDADGAYVGLSYLMGTAEAGSLQTNLTGVVRAWRRKGVAMALKVAALSRAKARGDTRVITWNESGNTGMLGINRRLGFAPLPAWITLEKTLADAGEETP